MTQNEPIRPRVFIVDDSCTTRSFLEPVLSARLGYSVVGIASDGDSATPLIRRLQPDLVLIDLTMPYINGQQLLKALEAFPEMYKVVLWANAFSSVAMKTRLESMGVDACLSKDQMSRDVDEFCRLLAAVVQVPKLARKARTVAISPANVPVASYPIPADERERIAALNALALTNLNADRRLDMLTEHLVKTTGFAACVMTFIDQDTQWIKSGHGFDRCSMPRAQAVCNHTICADEPFIVQDLSADIRFAKLDAVKSGPMIRSYVGYPIIASSGVRLGALCLIDTKPCRVSIKDLSNLRSMARVASEVIESGAAPMTQAA